MQGFEVGDHIVYSFVAACGICPFCADGHSNLCDNGAAIMGGLMLDGTSRIHVHGQDASVMAGLGTFSEHCVVHEWSAVKVLPDLPLDKVVLLGCGATTGWGSAVYAADVRPGDNVAVIGVGGLGSAAVQGARLAGAERIFAIDPVEFKRETAQKFGATHTANTAEEAFELIQQETWGRMCNKVILTKGVGRGDEMAAVMAITSKLGKVVVTNIHPWDEVSVSIPMTDLTLSEKSVVGSLFGSANPRADIPRLAELYRKGQLDLDGMITRTYSLDADQRGLPGHARRQEHPGRHRLLGHPAAPQTRNRRVSRSPWRPGHASVRVRGLRSGAVRGEAGVRRRRRRAPARARARRRGLLGGTEVGRALDVELGQPLEPLREPPGAPCP